MKKSEKTEGLLNWSDLRQPSGRIIYTVMLILLIILSLVCLIPVLWMFVSAFKTTQEMYAIPPKLLPSSIDLSRIAEVWKTAHIGNYALNSLWIIIGCLAFDIVFNGLAGYVLSRIKPFGTNLLNTLLFWTMMLPGISMVPLYMTFADFPIIHANLMGSFLPLWLMSATNAFNIFLFRNFFNSIPMGYIEAARIDGCSNLRAFFSIILPLSAPIISVVTIFSVIGSWGNFFWPYLILGDTGKEPVSIMLYNLTATNSPFQDNDRMLIMMLAALPSIIIYAIFSKRIMGGLNMSGIKG